MVILSDIIIFFFFFNDTATTEIYTLSLHDALPISFRRYRQRIAAEICYPVKREHTNGVSPPDRPDQVPERTEQRDPEQDRKSTRLNSSHLVISYAVFCLKKKKKK